MAKNWSLINIFLQYEEEEGELAIERLMNYKRNGKELEKESTYILLGFYIATLEGLITT